MNRIKKLELEVEKLKLEIEKIKLYSGPVYISLPQPYPTPTWNGWDPTCGTPNTTSQPSSSCGTVFVSDIIDAPDMW